MTEPTMDHPPGYLFTAPLRTVELDALLFDMDGTIIDSTNAIIKHWRAVGEEIGVDGDVILKTSHGRRSIDVLAVLAPELATWKFVCEKEGQIPIKYGEDAVEIPGARALLDKAVKFNAAWAIVTSGTRPLVNGWLDRMQLAHPRTLVSAEDVERGKPDPSCYELGAERVALAFGREEGEWLRTYVFEDAPAGIRAGRAAGFQVIALATTHSIEELKAANAHVIIRDLRSVDIVRFWPETGRVSVTIKDALWSVEEEGAYMSARNRPIIG